MRFRLHARLRRIASGLMLLGMVAFVQQSAMIAASQALASAGSMSDPAVTLSGPVHYHDSLARHVHVHDGTSGHIHKTTDIDSDKGSPLFWSLGCVQAVIPALAISAVSFEIVRVDQRPYVRLEGIRLDGLNRPPSTPSIA
jgi:hypothetical protein